MVTGDRGATDRGATDRGAKIVDLDAARVARLGRSLEAALDAGHVIAEVSTVANVDEWRKAARAIAAAHDWRVRTGVTRDESTWGVTISSQ
jgi:hypothetical protein